ncbi:MAG TPA: glycosyltransferase family 4 protein [Burkholderiales bacterium]|jgi:glycosyltransferase involved in cell wall biosynthesis
MYAEMRVHQGAEARGGPDRALPRAAPSVCFVAPHGWPVLSRDPALKVIGGAEVQQAILARLLAAAGHRVSMISLDYGQPERSQVDGVTVHRAFEPDAGLPVLRYLHPRLTGMWRALGEADADVYYYRSSSMWVGVLAEFCRRNGRRSIYAGASDRDFDPGVGGQIRYARDRWLYQRGLAAVDCIVVQNELQARACRAHYGREAVLIPSCYQLPEQARPAPEASDRVLWVGTIQPNKRPEQVLELARRLPQRRFVMVGGPAIGASAGYYEGIEREAKALPNLQFRGFLPLAEAERCFDDARLLVSTSLFEGMPNVFLQAWARGIPTVATVDVGAAANRVAQDVDGLAAEVESLLASPARWASASRSVREYFARTHSAGEVLARYERVLREVMTGAAA